MSFGGLRGFHVLTLPLYVNIANEDSSNGGMYQSAIDNLLRYHPNFKETRARLRTFEDRLHALTIDPQTSTSRRKFIDAAKRDPLIVEFMAQHVFTLGLGETQGKEYSNDNSVVIQDVHTRFQNTVRALRRGQVEPEEMSLKPLLDIDFLTSKDAFAGSNIGADPTHTTGPQNILMQLWLRHQFPRLSTNLTDHIVNDITDGGDVAQIEAQYPTDWPSILTHALYRADNQFLDADLYGLMPTQTKSRVIKFTLIMPLSSSPHMYDDDIGGSNVRRDGNMDVDGAEAIVSTGNERDDALWSLAQHFHHRRHKLDSGEHVGSIILNMPRLYIAQIDENKSTQPADVIRGAAILSQPTIRSRIHRQFYAMRGRGYNFVSENNKTTPGSNPYVFPRGSSDSELLTQPADGTPIPQNIIRGFASRVALDDWRLRQQAVRPFYDDTNQIPLVAKVATITQATHVVSAHLSYTRLPLTLHNSTVLFRRVNNVHPNTMHLTGGGSRVAVGAYGAAVRVAWSFGHTPLSTDGQNINNANGDIVQGGADTKPTANINAPMPNARNFATLFELQRYIRLIRGNTDVNQPARYHAVGRHIVAKHNVLQTVNLWFTTADDNTNLVRAAGAAAAAIVTNDDSAKNRGSNILSLSPRPYMMHLNLPIPLDLDLDWDAVEPDQWVRRLSEVTTAYRYTCDLLYELYALFRSYGHGPRERRQKLTKEVLQIYVTTYLNPMHRMLYPSSSPSVATQSTDASLVQKYPHTWSHAQHKLLNQLADPYSRFETNFHVDMSIEVRTRNIIKVMETRRSNAMGEYSYMHYLALSLRYNPETHWVESVYDYIPQKLASVNSDNVAISRRQANLYMRDAYLPSVHPPDLSLNLQGVVLVETVAGSVVQHLPDLNRGLMRIQFADSKGTIPLTIDRLQSIFVDTQHRDLLPWAGTHGDNTPRGGLHITLEDGVVKVRVPPPTSQAFCPAYQASVQMNPDGADSILMPHMTRLDLGRVIEEMNVAHQQQVHYELNQTQQRGQQPQPQASLDQLIAANTVTTPPLTITQLLVGIADTFGAIHMMNQLGLAHLDLKPENVLVDGNGQCYLTDLGFLTPYGRQGMLGTYDVITEEMRSTYPGPTTADGRKYNDIVPFDAQADSIMMATGFLRDLFDLPGTRFSTFQTHYNAHFMRYSLTPQAAERYAYDYDPVMTAMMERLNREALQAGEPAPPAYFAMMRGTSRATIGLLGATANTAVLDYLAQKSGMSVEKLAPYMYRVPDEEYIDPSQLPCTPALNRYICDQVFTTLAELAFKPQLDDQQIINDSRDSTKPLGVGSLTHGFVTDIGRHLGGYTSEWQAMEFEDQQAYGFMNKLKAAEIRIRMLVSQVWAEQNRTARHLGLKAT